MINFADFKKKQALPNTTLKDEGGFSLDGHTNDADEMPQSIKDMYFGTKLKTMFEALKDENGYIDAYEAEGELLNQVMQCFPELKDAWAKLSPDQKWIFTQLTHYGIRPLLIDYLGYRQVD